MTYYRIISEVIEQAKKGTLVTASPLTDKNVNNSEMIGIVKDIKKSRDQLPTK